MTRDATDEIRTLTWDEAAKKCVGIYREHAHALSS